jgi:hypothetical protein
VNERPKRLVSVAASTVQKADLLDLGAGPSKVTDNTRGANGQRYVEVVTEGGAPIVHEFDPTQKVSVWR